MAYHKGIFDKIKELEKASKSKKPSRFSDKQDTLNQEDSNMTTIYIPDIEETKKGKKLDKMVDLEKPSTSKHGKRQRRFIDEDSDGEDYNTTKIYIPDKKGKHLDFIFEKDFSTFQKWKTEKIANLEISLLHCTSAMLIEKELMGGNVKRLRLPIKECQLLVKSNNEILEIYQQLLDDNFSKTAYAKLGEREKFEIQFKCFEGQNMVDIREYFVTQKSERKPCRNGVMFFAEDLAGVIEIMEKLLQFCNI